jgi:hypothetical protein
VQLGAPLSLGKSAAFGGLSASVFKWYQVSLAGNAFGLLAPNTRYWLALLPGSTFKVTASPSSHYSGVLLGGLKDEAGVAVPNAAGDATLYTTRELGSQVGAGDAVNSCRNVTALSWLRSQSNWASVPSAGKRFRSSTGVTPYNLVRVGMEVWGREALAADQ